MTSPSAGRNTPEQVFRSQLKSVVRILERSIDDLLENFWAEPLRRHAHEVSAALVEGCKNFGYLELGGVTRAITSLLALPREEVLPLQKYVTEKLRELLGLLKEMAAILVA